MRAFIYSLLAIALLLSALLFRSFAYDNSMTDHDSALTLLYLALACIALALACFCAAIKRSA